MSSIKWLVLLYVINIFVPSFCYAQNIEIIAPLQEIRVKEGDDYARRALGNSWDFMQRRDVGWEENYIGSSIKSSSGTWKGTYASTGAYFFPLFAGMAGALFAEGLPTDSTLPRFGINHPIDTGKYTLLGYRLKQSNRSSRGIFWTTDINRSFWPTGDNYAVTYDGFYHAQKGYLHDGWRMYIDDMKNLPASFQLSGGSWNSKVFALRFDPSFNGPAGSNTEIDWVRLVDPKSGTPVNISWRCSDFPAKSMVQLYIDKDRKDYNGTPFAEFPAETLGQYQLNTAILPPGNHYFYAELKRNSDFLVLARSAYSAPINVRAAPYGYFIAPTTISGDEYSVRVSKNEWNMNEGADIANLSSSFPHSNRQFTNQSFSNGIFQAVADGPAAGTIGSDAQIHLNLNPGYPIDTKRYRYVTYRMAIDGTNFPTIADKVAGGFVARSIFWSQNIVSDGVTPPAHIVYEGWHTYTYDLRGSNAGFGLLEGGVPYGANDKLSHFRIDPVETPWPTWFFVDYVKLNAENAPKNSAYNVSWEIKDADSSVITAKLYYDTNNRDFNGRLITVLYNLKPGIHSYSWNTRAVTPGKYFVYLILSDGTNTSKIYAPVHIAVQ